MSSKSFTFFLNRIENENFKPKRLIPIFVQLLCTRNNVNEVIFVPYAKVNGDYDGYTKMMADAISNLGKLFCYSKGLLFCLFNHGKNLFDRFKYFCEGNSHIS